jgi:hypothetical protein
VHNGWIGKTFLACGALRDVDGLIPLQKDFNLFGASAVKTAVVVIDRPPSQP